MRKFSVPLTEDFFADICIFYIFLFSVATYTHFFSYSVSSRLTDKDLNAIYTTEAKHCSVMLIRNTVIETRLAYKHNEVTHSRNSYVTCSS